MIEDTVCRGGSSTTECSEEDPLLRWGDDISDSLLTDHNLTKERGRVEIDRQYTNRRAYDLVLHDLSWTQPAQLVQVDDISESKNGLLRNISISIQRSGKNVSLGCSVRVETNA